MWKLATGLLAFRRTSAVLGSVALHNGKGTLRALRKLPGFDSDTQHVDPSLLPKLQARTGVSGFANRYCNPGSEVRKLQTASFSRTSCNLES